MDTRQPFTIGAPVKVRYSSDPELPRDQWPKESGVGLFPHQQETAVALDDGRLVFVDPDDVEPA